MRRLGSLLVIGALAPGCGPERRSRRLPGIVELASQDIDGDPVLSRASVADPFGAPVLVANINSAVDDGPSFISLDGCRLYISSVRNGNNDTFVATRGT